MTDKKTYVTLKLKVRYFDESSFIRTSGEQVTPTADKVEGDAIQWRSEWVN